MDSEPHSQQKLIEIPTTSGITLKQFSITDAPVIFNMIDEQRKRLTQPGVKAGSNYQTLQDVEQSILNPKNPNKLRFGIWNESGQYIGTINLTPDEDNPKRAVIGYYLGEQYQGKGYMNKAVKALVSWAFNEDSMKEIYGRVNKGNEEAERSENVLKRAGFVESGLDNNGEVVFQIQAPTK